MTPEPVRAGKEEERLTALDVIGVTGAGALRKIEARLDRIEQEWNEKWAALAADTEPDDRKQISKDHSVVEPEGNE